MKSKATIPFLNALTLFVALVLACSGEEHCTATMSNQVPPVIRFSFSGFVNPEQASIEVEEVADNGKPLPKGNRGSMGKIIWHIKLEQPGAFRSWPAVTYGQIPPNAQQIQPQQGPPPALAEGKIYRCLVIGKYWPDMIFFKVENGKIVEVYGSEDKPLPDYANKHIEG